MLTMTLVVAVLAVFLIAGTVYTLKKKKHSSKNQNEDDYFNPYANGVIPESKSQRKQPEPDVAPELPVAPQFALHTTVPDEDFNDWEEAAPSSPSGGFPSRPVFPAKPKL